MNQLDLAAFLERVRTRNPFTDNRVTGLVGEENDVPQVHGSAFDRLVELARDALRERRGLGVMLWGEAGVGKSHVLARLGRWALRDDQAWFFSLYNLQASPEHLPRSILRLVVSQLIEGRRDRFSNTPLYRLVHAGVNEAVGQRLQFYGWVPLERAFLNALNPGDPQERAAAEVLFRFFKSVERARHGKEDGRTAIQAVLWLSGHALGLAEARSAGLPLGPPGDLAGLFDNQDIKAVFLTLCRLAGLCGKPLVLAFDQVDNLDGDQAAALSRFLQSLIDAAPNLLVITAGVQTTLLQWRDQKIIQDSAWDRLGQFEVQLHRVAPEEGLQIVLDRLRRVIDPDLAVPRIKQQLERDNFFPLGRAGLDRYLTGKTAVRPRDVLNRARDGWRLEQDALKREGERWLFNWEGRQAAAPEADRLMTDNEILAAIDRKVADKVAGHRAWRERVDSSLPADAAHVEGLLYSLLGQCRDAGGLHGVAAVERIAPARTGGKSPFDLLLLQRGAEGETGVRTGILVLTSISATSVAASLRRLLEDSRPLDRLFLVTDDRIGLPLGTKGLEYLHDLEQGGPAKFYRLEMSFADYAELDALQAVIGLARSGDLEIEPRPGQVRTVSEAEAVAAHHRLDHYLRGRVLHEILATGLATTSPPVFGPEMAAVDTEE